MLRHVCRHKDNYAHHRPQRQAAQGPPADWPAHKHVRRGSHHACIKIRCTAAARPGVGTLMPGIMRLCAPTSRGAHFEGQRRAQEQVEEGADAYGERVFPAVLGEASHAHALVDAPGEVELQQRQKYARLHVHSRRPVICQRHRRCVRWRASRSKDAYRGAAAPTPAPRTSQARHPKLIAAPPT
jgi:hypothetical protein